MSSIKEDHVARLNGVAEGVTEALGSEWTVSRPASHDLPSGLIISDGTRELHFYLSHGSDKVDLSGIYPDANVATLYKNGVRISRPRIAFSAKRPAAQLARDIERRFLPDYDKVRALVVERMESEATDAARLAAAMIAMAAALGTTPRGGSTQLSTPVRDRTGYGDFRPNSDGSSWEITLRSVPEGVAQRIAEIMTTNR